MYNMLLKNVWLMWYRYFRVMNEGGSFPPSNDLYLPSLPTCRGGGGGSAPCDVYRWIVPTYPGWGRDP